MADHVGGGEWKGWIPGCACQECAEALSARQLPVLRLALGGEEAGEPEGDGWTHDTRSLRALAVALEHLVGAEPDLSAWSDEAAAWYDRYGRATQILAEVSNRNAALLRSAAGPLVEDGDQPGRGLLVVAAITVERGEQR